MPYWLTFALLAFASFRLTRLIVKDDFPPIAAFRSYIQRARPAVRKQGLAVRASNGHVERYDLDGGDPNEDPWRWWWAGELVSCHWCVSAYVAAGAVACVDITAGVPMPVLWAFATWGAAAVLTDRWG